MNTEQLEMMKARLDAELASLVVSEKQSGKDIGRQWAIQEAGIAELKRLDKVTDWREYSIDILQAVLSDYAKYDESATGYIEEAGYKDEESFIEGFIDGALEAYDQYRAAA
jgi:hypothetical protein